MRITYDLTKPTKEEKALEELAPRHHCRAYVEDCGGIATLISKEEFDKLHRGDQFKNGPHREIYGNDPTEPNNPNRQAFGQLKSGEVIYCELSQSLIKKFVKLKAEITSDQTNH